MKKRSLFLWAVMIMAMLLLLTSCSTKAKEKKDDDLTISDAGTDDPEEDTLFDKLQLGMTREEVREILGMPDDPTAAADDYSDFIVGGIKGTFTVGYVDESVTVVVFLGENVDRDDALDLLDCCTKEYGMPDYADAEFAYYEWELKDFVCTLEFGGGNLFLSIFEYPPRE